MRRSQDATIELGDLPVAPGSADVRAELGLGGVTSLLLDEQIEFAYDPTTRGGTR